MSVAETQEYRSPVSKLVRFFHRSRDQWKAKCLEAKAGVKGLRNRIRYLELSRAECKAKAMELEQELARFTAQHNRAQSPEDVKKNG